MNLDVLDASTSNVLLKYTISVFQQDYNKEMQMKKLLLLISVIALSASAFAQSETEMKTSAQLRMRYWNILDQYGTTGAMNGSEGYVDQRGMLTTTMRKGERLGAQVTLIQNTRWGNALANSNNYNAYNNLPTGGTANSTMATPNGIGDASNMLLVNEFWGWWKASDSLTLRLGRGGYTIADGSAVSRSDWNMVPYSFDGAMAQWDTEPLTANFFIVTLEQLGRGAAAPAGTINLNDPETNIYGVSLDAKNLPGWLSVGNLDLLDLSGAQSGTNVATLGKNVQHIGISAKGMSNNVDYHLDAAYQMGKLTDAGTNIDYSANMFDAQVGYMVPDAMKLHVFLNYHMDSGDNDANTITGANPAGADNKWGRYDSLFYDAHKFSGMMNMLAWGNLSYFKIGAGVTPMDGTKVCLQYLSFSRSNKNDDITPGDMGRVAFSKFIGDATHYAASATSIGSELDLNISHKLDNGFKAQLLAGAFMPGSYLKAATNSPVNSTITQVMLGGTMNF